MSDKVSVVIPVYNTVGQLARCLDSVLAQTHPCVELITVDDGSTDGSYELCERYAAEHAGMRALRMPQNGGPALARNAGIDAASGEWLLFLDSDDTIAPDCVARLLAMAEENVDIVLCGYNVREATQSKVYRVRLEERVYPSAEVLGLLYEPIPLHFYSCIGNKLYRLSTLNGASVRIDATLRSCNDLAFSMAALAASIRLGEQSGAPRGVAYVDAALYEYLKREGSITRSYRRRMFAFWGGVRTGIRRLLEAHGLFEAKKALYFAERSVVLQKAVMQEVLFQKGYAAYRAAFDEVYADGQTRETLDSVLRNGKLDLGKRLMFTLLRNGRKRLLYAALLVVCLGKRLFAPKCD